MKWIKLFETFVYEDITSTPKNTPKLNIVKKPYQKSINILDTELSDERSDKASKRKVSKGEARKTPTGKPKIEETNGPNNLTSTTSTTTQKPTTTNTTTPSTKNGIYKGRTLPEVTVRARPTNVDNTDILSKYLNGNLELIKIYQEIEKELDDKFTEDHFKKEIKITGGLKSVSNGMNPNTLAKFQKMKKEVPSLEINSLSHRSLKTQQEMFINIAKKRGGKIINGLQQASLPGFSQHHTGKAIDVLNYIKIPGNHQEFYKKYGFELPYPTPTGFRIAEPWHIVDNS